MTTRLEKAIAQLSPDQLRELESFAESLAARKPASGSSYSLSWVGKGAHLYPEHATGVEAAHAAGRMWIEAVERSLSK
jgi:hypothetical protein